MPKTWWGPVLQHEEHAHVFQKHREDVGKLEKKTPMPETTLE